MALFVVRGASNREAAAELFVSPKTIDFHLRNIYRKLGLCSRAGLGRLVALEPVQPASPGGCSALEVVGLEHLGK